MRLEQLGEFGLIDLIKKVLPPPSKDVIVGIGDDVAVIRGADKEAWLLTCDVQVEGSHFTRTSTTPRDLGRKTLAINQSDIAACGGTPRFALVSLGLPPDLETDYVEQMYVGLRTQAAEFGTEIVGGNVSRSANGIFVDIFLMGRAPEENILLRSGARPGDKLLVTGTLGDAAAGLAALSNPQSLKSAEYSKSALSRYRLPIPRVREGIAIGASHMASAMIDISDGLGGDVRHICEKSGVGCRIYADHLPVAPENRMASQRLYGNEWHLALHGGEDYELLFTAPAAHAQSLADEVHGSSGTQVSIIGDILPAEKSTSLILPNGESIPLDPEGWDHFKS